MAKKNRNNLSHVGENIKKIRQARKLSQAEFSKIFSLARASIGAYEEGRSEPKIETLISIANYFSISIDALLTRKLTVTEIYKFNRLNEKLDRVHQSKRSGDNGGVIVDFLKVNEYLNYIVQRSNKDFRDQMEKAHLPNQFSNADIAIEMNGGEMTLENRGIFHGDILIGNAVSTKALTNYVDKVLTIMLDEEIFTRRLSRLSKNELTLIADNPAYPERIVQIADILHAWSISGVISEHIPSPMQTEERLLRIEEELKRLSKGN